MAGPSTSREPANVKDDRPQTYQERIKGEEFLKSLKHQGLRMDWLEECLSRVGDSADAAEVSMQLHPALRLLLSSTKTKEGQKKRGKLQKLLMEEAIAFNTCHMEEVDKLEHHITLIVEGEQGIGDGAVENLEMDLYVHARAEWYLPPVTPISIDKMGIESSMFPLHTSTPEQSFPISTSKPNEVTPSPKHHSNGVNLGEVTVFGANLVKEVAKLECAATYALIRASHVRAKDERVGDVLKVVGYAALGMSMIEGSSIAAAMISLHPDFFPNLVILQDKEALAYLFSQRSVYDDVTNIIEHHDKHSCDIIQCKDDIQELRKQMQRYMQLIGECDIIQCKDGIQELRKQMQRYMQLIVLAGVGIGAILLFRRQ